MCPGSAVALGVLLVHGVSPCINFPPLPPPPLGIRTGARVQQRLRHSKEAAVVGFATLVARAGVRIYKELEASWGVLVTDHLVVAARYWLFERIGQEFGDFLSRQELEEKPYHRCHWLVLTEEDNVYGSSAEVVSCQNQPLRFTWPLQLLVLEQRAQQACGTLHLEDVLVFTLAFHHAHGPMKKSPSAFFIAVPVYLHISYSHDILHLTII